MSDDWPGRARREQSKAHPIAREAIQAMLPQLLIVFATRLGGNVQVPASEIDATGDRNLSLKVNPDGRSFTFVVEHK